MSRVGLVSFIFFSFFTGLVTSAPLVERLSSLAERDGHHNNGFVTRSLVMLDDREIDNPKYAKREYLSIIDDRGFDMEDDEYSKREYDLSILDERNFEELELTKRDNSDIHVLYRRESIFTKIKHGFQKLGHALKKGFEKVKEGFQKVGHVLKTGFQKVGTFIKKTAGKVAKFGLKLVAAAASVASKVLKFIPGVGTALSYAAKGVAIGANAASNKIHANLGKLEKVDKGLDYVIDPFSAAAKSGKLGKAGKVLGALFR